MSDPEYDELFMTAMATARQRKAIFETEEWQSLPVGCRAASGRASTDAVIF